MHMYMHMAGIWSESYERGEGEGFVAERGRKKGPLHVRSSIPNQILRYQFDRRR